MTSKEMEERSGVPRANIRYYEAEGLLSPSRAKNGYRDYSEADLAALEKILYGDNTGDGPRLPLPDEVLSTLKTA